VFLSLKHLKLPGISLPEQALPCISSVVLALIVPLQAAKKGKSGVRPRRSVGLVHGSRASVVALLFVSWEPGASTALQCSCSSSTGGACVETGVRCGSTESTFRTCLAGAPLGPLPEIEGVVVHSLSVITGHCMGW
jgi:hypothetical protein